METKVTFEKRLPEQRGTGRNGEWMKQEFVCSTGGEFSRDICFSLWGDKIQQLNGIKQGDEITVKFAIESREHEGRYFTEVRAWQVIGGSGVKAAPAPDTAPVVATTAAEPVFSAPEAAKDEDNLPY